MRFLIENTSFGGNLVVNLGGALLSSGDPGPKSTDWHKANIVEVKQIPGKGKKFITIRTSDGVLWECDITVRSISQTRYVQFRNLVDDGGPFMIKSAHGNYKMYLIDGNVHKGEGEGELETGTDDGVDLENVGDWTLKFLEAND